MRLKHIIQLLIFFLFTNQIIAENFRTFHDSHGRTIDACLRDFDPHRNLVEVVLKNKTVKKVAISVFSNEDQAYIRDWHKANVLFSETALRLTAKKEKLHKEILKWPDSLNDDNWLASDLKVEDIAYQLELKNNCGNTLTDLEIEYCIYYTSTTQSSTYKLDSGGGNYEPGWVKQSTGPEKTKTKMISGSWDIPELHDRQKANQQSKTVQLRTGEERNIAEEARSDRIVEDALLGLRIRVYVTPKLMKEYSFPEQLSQMTAWPNQK